MKQFMVFLIIALCWCDAYANEPLWTEKERQAKRDIVIEGEVLNLKKLHELKRFMTTEVWSADIKVSEVHKGEKKLKGKTVSVLFTRGTIIEGTKYRNQRCPQHAELEKGDKGKFYIVRCTKAFLENLELKEYSEGAFLIPGLSDVVKAVLGKEKKDDNPDAGDGK